MERVDYQKLVIQELLNSHRSGELDIAPWYQRRSVWTTAQKSYLINTLFEQKPVPSIYIRHYLSVEAEKSIKEVVDGQQRIRAIIEYVRGDFSARHPTRNKRVKYAELTPTERGAFLMTSLSIGYLIGADDSDVIEIFGRLNSVAKTLNAQEKRSARYSGEVKQFCLSQSARRVNLWRDLCIFSANDIARMNEVQFIGELALNMLNGLSDYSSHVLDEFYRQFDDEFPHQKELDGRMDRVFSKIAELDPSAIKDTIFARHPLFFSLFIVLDSIQANITKSKLEDGIHYVDQRFNADTPTLERIPEDAEFYLACTASTQRIKSRHIRDGYIRKALRID